MPGMWSDPAARRGRASAGARAAVPVLAAAAAAVVTTEFVIVGLLPSLATGFAVDIGRAGWMVSVFAVSAAVFGPVLTLIAGRGQPRTGLSLALGLFGLAGVASAIPLGFWSLFVIRAVQGALLTFLVSVASEAAAAEAVPGQGGRAIGHVNMGVIVGTLIASPLGVWGGATVGWAPIYAGLGLCCVAIAVLLRFTVPPTQRSSPDTGISPLSILRKRRFLGHLLLSFLVFAAMFSSFSFITSLFDETLGVSGAAAAVLLFGFGVAGLLGNWIASNAVDRHIDRLTALVLVGLAVSAGFVAILGWLPILDLVTIAIWGGCHAAAFVACQVRVMFQAPQSAAFAGSLNIAVCNLGIAFGTLAGGWTLTIFGMGALAITMAAFCLCGLAVNLCLLVQPSPIAEGRSRP